MTDNNMRAEFEVTKVYAGAYKGKQSAANPRPEPSYKCYEVESRDGAKASVYARETLATGDRVPAASLVALTPNSYLMEPFSRTAVAAAVMPEQVSVEAPKVSCDAYAP